MKCKNLAINPQYLLRKFLITDSISGSFDSICHSTPLITVQKLNENNN